MKFSSKLIYFLFFLSGATGLIYEIVWGRLLVLIFGSTTNSIVAVISAFLGGLAIGNLIFAKIADTLPAKKLIKAYGFLEIGVGITAVTTLATLPQIKSIYALVSDGSSVDFSILAIKFSLAILVITFPTILMGATLPVLVRLLKSQQENYATSVSLLYGMNTFGAVVGVVIAAFVSIELFGLQNTVFIAAVVNFLIGIVALNIRALKDTKLKEPPAYSSYLKLLNTKTVLVITAFCLSGFVSIAYEILWTRILTPTTGTFIYAFATILTIYLIGIALGSIIYSNFIKIVKSKHLAFGLSEVAIGFFALTSVILAHKFVIDSNIRTAALIIPSTVFMGLTFPAAVALISNGHQNAKIVGLSYFANTIGAILGGFTASFFLIPNFGSAPSIVILALVNFTIAVPFFLVRDRVNLNLKYLTFIVTCFLIFTTSWILTFRRDRLLDYTTDLKILTAKIEKIPHTFKEDEVASVFAFRNPEDNLQDLIIDGVSTTARVSETRLMAHIPITLHPNPQRVLVIAFGMGTTFRSSLTHGLQTDVVELVPSVPKMFHFFHPNSAEVLADPNGRIIINDGRNYAFLTDKKYDIVTIDPPPPFNAAGTTVLHSTEFYEDLKNILNPGGIVSQWIYYNASREDEVSMAIKSFIDIFPYVLAYQKTGSVGGLFMEGSFSPMHDERIKEIFRDKVVIKDLREIINFQNDSDLQKLIELELVGNSESLAKKFLQSPAITDNNPRSEYFILRHKFSDSPSLVEKESARFVEELKANLSAQNKK